MKKSIAGIAVLMIVLLTVMTAGTATASAETKEASDWYTLYEALDNGNQATGEIDVILTKDIEALPLLHVIRLRKDAKATLDMNGYSIYGINNDYNYFDVVGELNVVNSKETVSKFENFSDYVFAVQAGAKLTINSGVKLCNNCRGIGEAPVHTMGDFIMNGCEISGNKVVDDEKNTMGAAVVVDKAGTLTLKGDFKFADNTTYNKKTKEKYNCDILLMNKAARIVLPEELKLEKGPINVSARDNMTITKGWSDFNKDKTPLLYVKSARKNGLITIDTKAGELKYTIKKAANTLSVKAKTYKAKYKTLKKKSISIARKKVLTVSGAKGTVTYAKTKGNKKITVAKKTGKITLKKGLKKGTYKVKIKVNASGDKYYFAKAVTKTVTIKVK